MKSSVDINQHRFQLQLLHDKHSLCASINHCTMNIAVPVIQTQSQEIIFAKVLPRHLTEVVGKEEKGHFG